MTPFVMWAVLDRITLQKGELFATEAEATKHAETEQELWRLKRSKDTYPLSGMDAVGPLGMAVPILCVQVDGCVFVISEVGWKVEPEARQ